MDKIITVTMPDIGEGVVEGEVIAWLKRVGDPVAKDEPVVSVMTDKATVELPSPYAGVLQKQYYREGETALVGKPLYAIAASGEVKKVLAAPATRKVAKERGIDLGAVVPTGKEGQVTRADLETFRPEEEVRPLHGIPKLMAKKMSESHREVVDFSYFEQVDATRLIQLKNKLKQEEPRVTFMPLFVRALSLALKKFPKVNSSLVNEAEVVHPHHNIGIAASTAQGLIVPVLKGVEKMSLEQVIHAYEAMKEKVLAGKLEPADMQGGTITISNFGTLSPGSLWATPVIHYPESAILALAKIHKLPVVINDQIVIREMLNLSWTFDHRLIDGDLAARFAHTFASLIANPNLLC